MELAAVIDHALPNEALRLATLRALDLVGSPPDERFDRVVRLARQLFDTPIAYLSLVDEDLVWFKSQIGLDLESLARATCVCTRTILGDGPTVIADLTMHPDFKDHPLVTGPAGLRAYAGCPIRAINGQKIGTVSVIDVKPREFAAAQLEALVDLAAMAEAELARLEAEEALTYSEVMYRKLGEAAFDGVMVSENGVVIEANQAAADMLRMGSPAALIGRTPADLSPPECLAEVRERIARGDERPYETIALLGDGARLDVEVVGRTYELRGRKLRVSAFRDLTERRRLERQKEQFVAVVSHDLKNPLGAIALSLETLLDDVVPDIALADADREELTYWLGMGKRAIGRMVRLTSDLLDDERLKSGAMPMRRRRCHSAVIFEEAAWTMRAEAERGGVAIAVEGSDVALYADRDRILQVVGNLLGNALKFTPSGGRVVLRAEATADASRLIVEDTGRGIPTDKLETVFERFEQVELDDARLKGGTGLGLSICRAIAHQHGGRLWAENRSEGGSRFTLELPAEAPTTS